MSHAILVSSKEESVDDDLLVFFMEKYNAERLDRVESVADAQGASNCDLVLVYLPDIDNATLQACGTLRTSKRGEAITLIIVSKTASPEKRIKGFEVGVDDFIDGNSNFHEIESKIDHMTALRKQRAKYKSKWQDANKKTMSVINELGELSEILVFLDKSFNSDSYEKIAAHVFYALEGMDLHSSLDIRLNNGERITLRDQGALTPLENDVFLLLAEKGRIFDFGSRTIFNYENFSLLIRNMPMEDSIRYGRLRDSLAILSAGANTKIKSLMAMQELLDKNKKISGVLHLVSEKTEELSKKTHAHNVTIEQTVNQLVTSIELSFGELGLNEAQENYFLHLISQSLDRVFDSYSEGSSISEIFDGITASLRSISD